MDNERKPDIYIPQGISFTGESLKELDRYISQDDPDFPKTLMMWLELMEDSLLLVQKKPEECIYTPMLPEYKKKATLKLSRRYAKTARKDNRRSCRGRQSTQQFFVF